MDLDRYDPDLRRAGRLMSLLTPRSASSFRRQVGVIGAVSAAARALRPTPAVEDLGGGVEQLQRWVPRRDGGQQRLLVVRRRAGGGRGQDGASGTADPGAAVLWIHGGGYAVGAPEQSVRTARRLVEATGCVVVLNDYRLSAAGPYPAALHDCYDALLWLRDHAAELGARPDQLVVGGESAGGGLTAATCLLARERGEVAVAFQVPLYPMIDDRPTPSSTGSTAPVWSSATNDAAWDAYLGPLRGRADVPATAAPARAQDLRGLPPVLTFVGDAEPFHDEVVTWAERLREAGVRVESRVYPGCFHGFDILVPTARVSREATAFLLEGFRRWCAELTAPQPTPQPARQPAPPGGPVL
ncbi:alpha/beta hydrolase [Quadrisphaera sp. KR29]|uniref:alpha/beta hydrolase n=1 Tax=Quadrisphaera sp. KR29 TaxID=3461391 RepID=UPI004044BD5F